MFDRISLSDDKKNNKKNVIKINKEENLSTNVKKELDSTFKNNNNNNNNKPMDILSSFLSTEEKDTAIPEVLNVMKNMENIRTSNNNTNDNNSKNNQGSKDIDSVPETETKTSITGIQGKINKKEGKTTSTSIDETNISPVQSTDNNKESTAKNPSKGAPKKQNKKVIKKKKQPKKK